MHAKRIFYFWEPHGTMPPYVRLCMQTWEVNLSGYDVVALDYANLDRYVGRALLDLPALKRLGLSLQKEAISVAVMYEHGGVFMDVDTIVTGDIALIVQKLAHTEFILFNRYLAFLAARPRAQVLTRWLAEIQQRLARLGRDGADPGWGYVGNLALEDVLEDMISASGVGRAYEALVKTQASWPRWMRAQWRGRIDPIWARRRGLVFRTIYRKYLTMLDRKRYGFIAEAFDERTVEPSEGYRRFWFEGEVPLSSAFRPRQRLIALHNSWTPDWYKRLTEQQVLEHDCLLSRTLRRVLRRDRAA